MRLGAFATLFAASGLIACAKDTTSAPEPPDVTALRAAYAPADGPFSAKAAPFVARGVYEKVTALAQGQSILTEVQDLLHALDKNAEMDAGVGGAGGASAAETGLAVAEQGLSGQATAWARVRHICEGFSGHEPPDMDENGRIDLFVTYRSDDGVNDVVWGDFHACRLPAGADAKQELGGLVTLVVNAYGADGGLFALDMTWLDPAGVATPLRVDFAFDTGRLVMSQALPDGGHVLVGVQTDANAGDTLFVEDDAGTWGCQVQPGYEHGTCTRGEDSFGF